MTSTITYPNPQIQVVDITAESLTLHVTPKENSMELVNVQQREPIAGRWHVTSDSWGIPGACSEEDIKGSASYEPTGYQSGRIMVRVYK